MSNPFDRFIAADQRLDAGRKQRGEDQHTDAWWSRYLGEIDHSNVSRWRAGTRRIGPKHERRVFRLLTAYWDKDEERWRGYRFTLDEYRQRVMTGAQTREAGRVQRARKRRQRARERDQLQDGAS